MKDNIIFKMFRGIQRVVLTVVPFVAAVFVLKGELQSAMAVLVVWTMIVTSMLTITKPKG